MAPSDSTEAPEPALALTAGQLAGMLGADLIGDASVTLTGVEALDRAGPSDLSFVRSSKFAAAAAKSKAGTLLVSRSVTLPAGIACPVLTVDDADEALRTILTALREHRYGAPVTGIHPRAVVHDSATLGEGVFIGPGAVIEAGVRVGAGSRILAGSVLCAGVTVGARCIIGPCAVIGSDGFGHAVDESTGARTLIPHAGGVRLGDDVEVGASSAIDRGKLADTVVGRGTKIDNLVQVAHNCIIGEDCVLCGLVGIAGSVRLGDRVIIAGQVGLADNVSIGSDVIVLAQSGVMRDITEPGVYAGMPARPRREYAGEIAAIRRMTRQRKSFRHSDTDRRDTELKP